MNLTSYAQNCEIIEPLKGNSSECFNYVFDNSVMNETIVTFRVQIRGLCALMFNKSDERLI